MKVRQITEEQAKARLNYSYAALAGTIASGLIAKSYLPEDVLAATKTPLRNMDVYLKSVEKSAQKTFEALGKDSSPIKQAAHNALAKAGKLPTIETVLENAKNEYPSLVEKAKKGNKIINIAMFATFGAFMIGDTILNRKRFKENEKAAKQ